MGCQIGSSSGSESEEFRKFEEKFAAAEQFIGFSMYKSDEIGNAFKRYALDNVLTINQLSKALDSLEIDRKFLSESRNPTKVLYDQFVTRSGRFSCIKLQTLGVLLGCDSVQDKSRTLFLTYDEDCSKSLDRGEVLSMLEDVFDISVLCLGELVCALNKEAEPECRKYINKLSRQRETVLLFYREILFYTTRDTITMDQFQRSVRDNEVKRLFCPSKLRKLAYEHHSEAPK